MKTHQRIGLLMTIWAAAFWTWAIIVGPEVPVEAWWHPWFIILAATLGSIMLVLP